MSCILVWELELPSSVLVLVVVLVPMVEPTLVGLLLLTMYWSAN